MRRLATKVSEGRSASLTALDCAPLKRHWQRLPIALACASLCSAALPAILDWTGTAPVLLASGDFGYGNTTIGVKASDSLRLDSGVFIQLF